MQCWPATFVRRRITRRSEKYSLQSWRSRQSPPQRWHQLFRRRMLPQRAAGPCARMVAAARLLRMSPSSTGAPHLGRRRKQSNKQCLHDPFVSHPHLMCRHQHWPPEPTTITSKESCFAFELVIQTLLTSQSHDTCSIQLSSAHTSAMLRTRVDHRRHPGQSRWRPPAKLGR